MMATRGKAHGPKGLLDSDAWTRFEVVYQKPYRSQNAKKESWCARADLSSEMLRCSRAPGIRPSRSGPGCSRSRWRSRAGRSTHPDAGLHAPRHTFVTEAGEYTDPFTLQYVGGHDNIRTTMRYVHRREGWSGEVVRAAGKPAAAGGSCRMPKVGAESGAVGDALRHRCS